MQVQRRMTEMRTTGGQMIYDGTGGILDLPDQQLKPGDVADVPEETARAFQHKLVKPGSQVLGEPCKPFAECKLDLDAEPKAKPKGKAKGAASGKESAGP